MKKNSVVSGVRFEKRLFMGLGKEKFKVIRDKEKMRD